MKANNIVIGKFYRLKSNPDYGYVKPVEIFRPSTWQMKRLAKGNGIKPFKYIVVKCESISDKNSAFGFIRYYKPVDIIECEEEQNG
jgi:hypothetical protein